MKQMSGILRRDLLRTAGTAAAVGVLAASDVSARSQVAAAQSQADADDPRLLALRGELSAASASGPRALALIGDRYHNYVYIRVSLDRLFKELDVPIDYTTNYDHVSRSLLEPYRLFICFRDNMIWPNGYSGPNHDPYQDFLENPEDYPPEQPVDWITNEQAEAIKDFVSAGNGMYSFHCSAFVSRSSKTYREVQGGVALGHPPLRPFKVRIANKNHPITSGIEDFIVTDEQEYTTYDKDPKNVLLRSENTDGLTFDRPTYQAGVAANTVGQQSLGSSSISGWAHEYGKGRVVFTGIGHTVHAMWQPEYFKMQKNAVRWLLKIS